MGTQASKKRVAVLRDKHIENEKDKKISELETLIQTISRGKYMWEATFDAITSPVVIVSADYRIQRANKAAASASQLNFKKMTGTFCYNSLAGRDNACHGCPVHVTLKTQNPQSSSLAPFEKSGSQYEVHAYPLAPLFSDQPQVVLHYRDITEEKELQRRLLQSEKMAAIGMLAGGVAHEINNPLGGILAFAQLAMRETDPQQSCYHDLKEIEEAALRCKRIVQDLLDFSRQNRDEIMTAVNLNNVLKKVIPLIQVQARTSRIDFEHDLALELPFILGNFHKLQQVFLNLATNAYQSMQQDKGGKITIKTYSEGLRVYAQVLDTGSGIPEENLHKIFDPYFTTKKQGEGTGLGLAITYGIVKEHQGQIDAHSQEGQGTSFILSFPIYEEKK